MLFRNLIAYRFQQPFAMTGGALEEKLSQHPLLPCAGLALFSCGWVSPRDNAQIVYSQGVNHLIALGVEQKILPAATVKQGVKERAAQFEREKGFKPGRKMLRELKDQVIAELLPRALPRRHVTRAWLSPSMIVMDTSSANRAEEFISKLVADLDGAIATEPLLAERLPAATLTGWLASRTAPGRFSLENDCELRSPDQANAAVRYVRHPLDGPEIRQHIAGGKLVHKLGLGWSDKLAFVLDAQGLKVKRLEFLSLAEPTPQTSGEPDADAMFDAEFTLETGEIGAMLTDLMAALQVAADGVHA